MNDLGEDEVLRHLRNLVTKPSFLPNDDASAINGHDSELLLLNVDGFVASTDAPPGMSYHDFGQKAALMAISDIVVKGGKTLGFLLSVSVPSDFLLDDLKDIVRGAKEFAEPLGVAFLGGDLNQAEDIVIDAVAVGTVSKSRVIPRSGARIGDAIVSPKWFGMTAIGLSYLLSGNDYGLPKKLLKMAVSEVYSPRPWISEFMELAKSGMITGSIDSSDGLAKSLHHLANASKKQLVITELPLNPLLERSLSQEYWFPVVFYGGEEFCPIFTISPEATDILPSEFVVIGEVKKGKGVIFSAEGESYEVLPEGWQHFER